ncbi:MAG: hypothetical protein JSV64_03020 [Candidatus Bathyarchaeota archaeon]|nr:MAG: hypothetical protein JSV64_03020 [Candidatus Bathyarchaeota archaeon]
MQSNINHSAVSVVLVLIAAASLLVMLSLTQINYLVHGDLYSFGLQFSYRWAMPYWVFSGLVFGLSWVNIFVAITLTLYIFKKTHRKSADSADTLRTKASEGSKSFIDAKDQRKLSDFAVQEQVIMNQEDLDASMPEASHSLANNIGEPDNSLQHVSLEKTGAQEAKLDQNLTTFKADEKPDESRGHTDEKKQQPSIL